MQRKENEQVLQESIGYQFKKQSLLRQALTHRSYGIPHNERLEFLGDSVLSLSLSALLYDRFPLLSEGELSRMRANLVNQQALCEIASKLNVGEMLWLGEGELKSGGRSRPSILADALEALMGAIYLDGGLPAAKNWIDQLYLPMLDYLDPKTVGKDPKTLLQEFLQGRKLPLPLYRVIKTEGAVHEQQFEVECEVSKFNLKIVAVGLSRRLAEQKAAAEMLPVIEGILKNKKHG
ncbi:ribonuclease III [Leeia sp. TBRC 13508]|uniref:Ribonuclease 3 n=1 Tax=Leeia speluncae TaxID=2884804 RepID=A0ABS8D3K7_9NEIS|nr:ribonuclease III [Leeia speluncae]MCB6182253.1 ribonuclease III [Leeia speluncae]